jgi:hypothetical protein
MTLNNTELSKPRELAVASKDTGNYGVTSKTLDAKDFGIGTVIVILMAVLFASVGGKPLIVTFIPWSVRKLVNLSMDVPQQN